MDDDLTRDYQRLIAEGAVIRDCPDAEAVERWREAMRERARADRLTIRTGTAGQMPTRAWAALPDTPVQQSPEEAGRLLDDYLNDQSR